MIHRHRTGHAEGKLPPVLKGFEHIKRYWDPYHNVFASKILPGEYYVSREGEMIGTVLGSCVSACIRDPKLGVGGMNHFMLPLGHEDNRPVAVSDAARYGNWAMELLINEILKQGGKKSNLEVKLFGGGNVLRGMTSFDVGKRNIDFVRKFIANELLMIKAEDLGDLFPRKVLFFSDTGSVKVKKLKTMRNDVVLEREQLYAKSIDDTPAEGDIELFD